MIFVMKVSINRKFLEVADVLLRFPNGFAKTLKMFILERIGIVEYRTRESE